MLPVAMQLCGCDGRSPQSACATRGCHQLALPSEMQQGVRLTRISLPALRLAACAPLSRRRTPSASASALLRRPAALPRPPQPKSKIIQVTSRAIPRRPVPSCAALRCAVLCRPALRCAVLRCAVLRCAALCCAALRCAALCCAVLRCAVLCCAVLCCAVPCCAVRCQHKTKLTNPLTLILGSRVHVRCVCVRACACVSQDLPTPVATLMKSTEPHADSYYQLHLEGLMEELGFRHVTTVLSDPRHRTVTASA